ncbi:MAG: CHASE2 domain-containing protein [Rhodothalassiaceae bacterium]
MSFEPIDRRNGGFIRKADYLLRYLIYPETSGDRKHMRLLFGAKIALLSVLGIFIHFLDPFGMGSASSQQASKLVKSIVGAARNPEMRNEVVVVLLTDTWMELAEPDRWPPSYDDYACLLNRLKDFEPRAVFLDVVLASDLDDYAADLHDGLNCGRAFKAYDPSTDRRSRLEWMLQIGQDAAPATPFRLATVPPDGEAYARGQSLPSTAWKDAAGDYWWTGIHPDIEAGLTVSETGEQIAVPKAKPALVSFSGFQDGYPLYFFERAEMPSPAMAIFQDVCAAQPLAIYYSACEDLPEAASAPPEQSTQGSGTGSFPRLEWTREVLVPQWGIAASRDQSRYLQAFGGEACELDSSQDFARFSTVMQVLWVSFTSGLRKAKSVVEHPSCPYIDFVYAEDIMTSRPSQDQTSGFLEDLLDRRIILIGEFVVAGNDRIETPFGLLPGVFLHAVSLENLLNEGAEFVRLRQNKDFFIIGLVTFFYVLSSLVGVGIANKARESDLYIISLLKYCALVSIWFVCMFLIAAFTYTVVRIEVGVWISALFFSSTFPAFTIFLKGDGRAARFGTQDEFKCNA